MIYVSNAILSVNGGICSGSGAIRCIETSDRYRLVIVDQTSVVATLMEVIKTSLIGDENVAIIMVKDERI